MRAPASRAPTTGTSGTVTAAGQSEAAAVAGTGAPTLDPDPWSAPEAAQRVQVEHLDPGTGTGSAVASPLDGRILELEQAMARDEEAIKKLISAPSGGEGTDSPVDSSELREIAGRLPELQAELRTLRARRGAAPAPEP